MKLAFCKLFICFCFLSFISCSDDDDKSIVENPSIVSSSVIDTLSIDQIKSISLPILQVVTASGESVEEVLSKMKYDVVLAKVEYKATDPFGEVKTLSGLVAYPVLPKTEKDKKLSVISIQHGTITSNSQAPTTIGERDLVIRDVLGAISASHENGYITVQPDYFGYGSDKNNLHYYELASSLAEASRKLIENISDYAKKQSLNISYDKLFLFGYSEGGGASIATLKSFSEKNSNFKNFVTVAGSGAYDKPATVNHIIQQTSGDSPQFSASYAWVALTYNSVYKLNRSLEELYTPAVAVEMAKYVNNNQIMTTQVMPPAPTEVFNSKFIEEMLDGSDKEFMAAFKDNDISDFTAKGKVHLVYGSNDTWVPPINTINANEKFLKRGVDVITTMFPGGTHSTTYPIVVYAAYKELH